MRYFWSLLLVVCFFSCDNGGSGGNGGALSPTNCAAANCEKPAPGTDIIPDAKGMSTLTPQQKDRVKTLMKNMDEAEKLVFENAAIQKERSKARWELSADIGQLDTKINKTDCTIETKFPSIQSGAQGQDSLMEIKISGSGCPVTAFKSDATKRTGSNTNMVNSSTSKSEFSIVDADFKDTLDIHEMRSLSTQSSTTDMDQSAGTMKMTMKGSGGGVITSKTEGVVKGQSTVTMNGSGSFDMSGQSGQSDSDSTVTYQMTLGFSDFTFYGEVTVHAKNKQRTSEYKINGQIVTEQEWKDITGMDLSSAPGTNSGTANGPQAPSNPANPGAPGGVSSENYCTVVAVQGRTFSQVNICLSEDDAVNTAAAFNGGQFQVAASVVNSNKFTLTVSHAGQSKSKAVDLQNSANGNIALGQTTVTYICMAIPQGTDPAQICN